METAKTLQKAVIYFSNPDNCLNYMASRRWPNGAICPTCGRQDVSFLANQKKWQCKSAHAKRQFSVKTGTIFEDSPLGLDKWLIAVWMITNCKNGVSSYEVHRAIGVTQKTAWFMIHRIRVAMECGSFEKLSGEVECDETYIGGKSIDMRAKKRKEIKMTRGYEQKTGVMGMLQRGGKIRAKVIKHAFTRTLLGLVNQNIEYGSTVMTDDHGGYRNMSDEDYIHEIINHACEYVCGNVHTNSIENFWSLLKRSIKGTYVSVEPSHLQKYVEDQVFRYNERKGNDSERFHKITSQLSSKRLTYAELTGKT
ncbi:MAG TPA: IS1595 family transposase, partial [Blastocatellia bacterium]|nr:IS1595 family transposase [Blastocatellia bacterium]